jgi:hypothetical protein
MRSGGQDAEIIAFVNNMGWTLPNVPQAVRDLSANLGNLSDLSTALELDLSIQSSGGTVTGDIAAQFVQLAANVVQLLDELGGLSGKLSAQLPPGFLETDLADQFLPRLIDLGVYQLMLTTTRRMEPILRLAGIIEVVDEPADAAKFQPAYQRRTIRWDRLGRLLSDPKGLFAEVQGLADPLLAPLHRPANSVARRLRDASAAPSTSALSLAHASSG